MISRKKTFLILLILSVLLTWVLLEFRIDNRNYVKQYSNNEERLNAFLDQRCYNKRNYSFLNSFFAKDPEYFYEHSEPSMSYIKLYYLFEAKFFNPEIDIEEIRKTNENSFRILGSKIISNKKYKFNEVVHFNDDGFITNIYDDTN